MGTRDYVDRSYLSAIEASKYLGITVEEIHQLAKRHIIKSITSPSGQIRFKLDDLKKYEKKINVNSRIKNTQITKENNIFIGEYSYKIFIDNSMKMDALGDNSVHLIITSPPYFNAKMYSKAPIEGDLGDIHDIDEWFDCIKEVWSESFRVLQPGRKLFINIMNLPLRDDSNGFRSLNLVGKTIDLCEKIGFIFKRDIVWHKTNGVRAHFGTYPYPGGILINNMHEFILEFNKPDVKGFNKYAHLSAEQKEQSKLEKEFWLSLKKSDVWLMKPQGSGDKRDHVAPFPYELPYRLIKAYCFIGETVLDPFLGSGKTMISAIDLKRNCIGYEINPQIGQDTVIKIKGFQMRIL